MAKKFFAVVLYAALGAALEAGAGYFGLALPENLLPELLLAVGLGHVLPELGKK